MGSLDSPFPIASAEAELGNASVLPESTGPKPRTLPAGRRTVYPAPMPPNLAQSLSESERYDLAARLAGRASAMSYHAVHGLFAALASLPDMVPPREWLTLVIGDEALESKAGAEELVGLVMRLFNDTLSQVDRADPALCPDAADADAIRDWCWGYAQGLEMDDPDRGVDSDEVLECLDVIEVLAEQLPPSEVMPSDADESAWLSEQRSTLLDRALLVHRSWAQDRVAATPQPSTQKPRPAVGRNDPCPCGSGKKYKKCCAN